MTEQPENRWARTWRILRQPAALRSCGLWLLYSAVMFGMIGEGISLVFSASDYEGISSSQRLVIGSALVTGAMIVGQQPRFTGGAERRIAHRGFWTGPRPLIIVMNILGWIALLLLIATIIVALFQNLLPAFVLDISLAAIGLIRALVMIFFYLWSNPAFAAYWRQR